MSLTIPAMPCTEGHRLGPTHARRNSISWQHVGDPADFPRRPFDLRSALRTVESVPSRHDRMEACGLYLAVVDAYQRYRLYDAVEGCSGEVPIEQCTRTDGRGVRPTWRIRSHVRQESS